jgi:hypothetical protein
MPTFGLPCPTTLYTIGLLAFLVAPYPRSTFVVPILWSAIGAQAAFFTCVPQDLSLIVAELVGVALVIRSRGKAGEKTEWIWRLTKALQRTKEAVTPFRIRKSRTSLSLVISVTLAV